MISKTVYLKNNTFFIFAGLIIVVFAALFVTVGMSVEPPIMIVDASNPELQLEFFPQVEGWELSYRGTNDFFTLWTGFDLHTVAVYQKGDMEIWGNAQIGDYVHNIRTSLTWDDREDYITIFEEGKITVNGVGGDYLVYNEDGEHDIVVITWVELLPVKLYNSNADETPNYYSEEEHDQTVYDRYVHHSVTSNMQYLTWWGITDGVEDYDGAVGFLMGFTGKER